MSVTRTPINVDPKSKGEDPTDPESIFYWDLEHYLKARSLYEQAKQAADRFGDRVKDNVESEGDRE